MRCSIPVPRRASLKPPTWRQRSKNAMLERALGAELQHHLTQAAAAPDAPANHHNGTSAKAVMTDQGAVPLAIPPDRRGTFACLDSEALETLHWLRRQDHRALTRPGSPCARFGSPTSRLSSAQFVHSARNLSQAGRILPECWSRYAAPKTVENSNKFWRFHP